MPTISKEFDIIKIINKTDVEERFLTELEELCANKDNLNLKIFFYDIINTAESQKLCDKFAKKYPNTVVYQKRFGCTASECYNEAMETCSGQWINFSKITSSYYYDSAKEIYNMVENSEISIYSLKPVQRVQKVENDFIYYNSRDCVIDLSENPFHTQLVLDACFLNKETIGDLRIKKCLFEESAFEIFLTSIYEKTNQYYIKRRDCRMEEYLPNDYYNYPLLYNKSWYTKEISNVWLPFIKENPSSRLRQSTIMKSISLKFAGNLNDRNKNILLEKDIQDFFESISNVFHYIDDDILIQNKWKHKKQLQRFMSARFLHMKYRETGFSVRNLKDAEDAWYISVNNHFLEYYKNIVLKIQAINATDQGLCIEGELTNVYFSEFNNIQLYLCCGKQKYEVERTEIYSLTKYFGKTLKKGYMVRCIVPIELYQKGHLKFNFELKFQDHSEKIMCKFTKFQSRLSEKVLGTYWKFGHHLLRYHDGNFSVKKYTWYRGLWREGRLLTALIRKKNEKDNGIHRKRILILRLIYWITIPFYKKEKIWITFDQLFKGGDNGEYFYRHVKEHHPDISMYYIINGDTKEYQQLKRKYQTVLKFGGLYTVLLSLHAQIIFATRVSVMQYCGINKIEEIYFRDIFQPKIVCLQHGLTIQEIAQYQNRLYDNTQYYFCVSPYEVRNIKQPIYGYTDDMIALTGAPRYDGLVSTPKRQILITPTWRRNVTSGTNEKGKHHEYSVNFKQTKYFEIYNTLINDERLIECAKTTGYKLIYLIHPILSPQINDFDTNDYVEIISGISTDYETALKEASLMVTDYSGIQFDFAYMKKPLIYYRPDTLPAQYEESDFGFGPICKNHEEIVDCLCKYMENNCQLEDSCRACIEDFFPYDDQNNCERVYQAAVKNL